MWDVTCSVVTLSYVVFQTCGPLWAQLCGSLYFYPGICAEVSPQFTLQPPFSPAIQSTNTLPCSVFESLLFRLIFIGKLQQNITFMLFHFSYKQLVVVLWTLPLFWMDPTVYTHGNQSSLSSRNFWKT